MNDPLARKKIAELLDTATGNGRILIVAQDNPDPDSIASALALKHIFAEKLRKRAKIVYGGSVQRVENRGMIRRLRIDLTPIKHVDPSRYGTVCLLDTQAATGNNSLPEGFVPSIVVDHHPIKRSYQQGDFNDIRPEIGATSTILTSYLHALDLKPSANLATALVYGIKSDTRDLGREATPLDKQAYMFLFPMCNVKLLSKIEHERLPRFYFEDLSDALRNAQKMGRAIIARVDKPHTAEIMPELSDLFIRHENIAWSVCYGIYDGAIYLSVRSSTTRHNSGKVAKRIVRNLGGGGGHKMMAGGRIELAGKTPEEVNAILELLEKRFRRIFLSDGKTAYPLVKSSEDDEVC
ncbi:bifunctional oligoribonuclease/PAP phosphatase NrnA [Candidatus Hydrogenedentota bacterium]